MDKLLSTMRRLRGPGGCPWDQEQTHQSLRQYLLEESYEAIDALSRDDTADIVEELGDVLLQIAFHTVIAEETKRFAYEDIETSIVDKLIRRHPHVFGDVSVSSADEVVSNWQEIKRQEAGGRLALSGVEGREEGGEVTRYLPALMLASEVGKKQKWVVENTETMTSESVGEALLELVNRARQNGINPEMALREAVDRRVARG
jgi:XTP/dITP diphosphohydrolase